MLYKKYFKVGLKYFLAPILLLFIIVVSFGLLYRAYLQNNLSNETQITEINGIDSSEEIMLGGVKQSILVRGHDINNPVLLFVHGGPGSVLMSHHRPYHTELEKNFTVVHWDQRGAGKSYSPDIPIDTMSLSQIVLDARELSELLIKRFKTPKIYLVGHSWGTKVGTIVASRYPELFYAYVGIGQLAAETNETERVSHKFALDRARELGNKKAIHELEAMGVPPFSRAELGAKWGWLFELGGVEHSLNMSVPMFLFGKGLQSPDYSLSDWLKYMQGMAFSGKHITTKADFHIDFITNIPKIDVPVYFFLGRYDYVTPSVIAERYLHELEAPIKDIVWFEDSGHLLLYEEKDKFMDMLVNKVLKETYPIKPETKE